MRTYGYQVDSNLVLCDDMSLPNTGSKDSDAIRWVGNQSGLAEIRVYAGSDITIASGNKLGIKLECFSYGIVSSAAPTFANSSGWIDDAHF